MEEHKCDQLVQIKRIAKILDGNGQLGLVKDVTNLKNDMTDVKIDLGNIATSIASLAKSQLEGDLIKKMSSESSDKRSKAIMQATSIIGAAGIIITAMLTFG